MRAAILAAMLSMTAACDAMAQPAAAKIDGLRWMSGTWVHESNGARVSESWLGPANGLMVAANLTAGPGAKRFHEFLRIAETPEGLSYFASPGGRAPVEFKLKTLEAQRVVFENAAIEYPQRILYWRDGEQLMARIEGSGGRFEEWRFSR